MVLLTATAGQTVCQRCRAVVTFPEYASYKAKCGCGATVLKRVPNYIGYYYCAYTYEIKQMKVTLRQIHCVCCGKEITLDYSKNPVIINGEFVYYQKKEEATFSHDTKDSDSRHEEIQRLRAEVKELKAEKEKLVEELVGAKNVNQYYHKNLSIIKGENEDYKQEIEYERACARRMTEILKEKEYQVRKLHQVLDKYATETRDFQQFKSKFEEVQKEMAKLDDRLIELEDANFLLTLNNEEQKETIDFLEKQHSEATLRCTHANFSFHHKENELKAVKEECGRLESLLAKREQADIRKITSQLQKDLEKMGILSVKVRAGETDYDKKMNQLKEQMDSMKKAVQEIGQKYLKQVDLEEMDVAEILEGIQYRMEEADVLREMVLILEEKMTNAGEKKYVEPLEFPLD